MGSDEDGHELKKGGTKKLPNPLNRWNLHIISITCRSTQAWRYRRAASHPCPALCAAYPLALALLDLCALILLKRPTSWSRSPIPLWNLIEKHTPPLLPQPRCLRHHPHMLELKMAATALYHRTPSALPLVPLGLVRARPVQTSSSSSASSSSSSSRDRSTTSALGLFRE